MRLALTCDYTGLNQNAMPARIVYVFTVTGYCCAFVICPLEDADGHPFAVAVDSGSSSLETFLIVHYSQKPLHSKYDNHIQIAEMVAASVVMGVDHFVFYVQNVGPSPDAEA
nr:hypothetical protein BaRGS_023420 [Batillaria attramentaria]